MCTTFLLAYNSAQIIKIDVDFPELWSEMYWPLFMVHSVYNEAAYIQYTYSTQPLYGHFPGIPGLAGGLPQVSKKTSDNQQTVSNHWRPNSTTFRTIQRVWPSPRRQFPVHWLYNSVGELQRLVPNHAPRQYELLFRQSVMWQLTECIRWTSSEHHFNSIIWRSTNLNSITMSDSPHNYNAVTTGIL